MPDLCHSGKLPPKDVAKIQEHIAYVCGEFADRSDSEFVPWVLHEMTALSQDNTPLALLASVGADVVFHIRGAGGFILTEPPTTETER